MLKPCQVSEAIQVGAHAMKENKISVEDVHLCLEELDEIIETQKEAARSLGNSSSARGQVAVLLTIMFIFSKFITKSIIFSFC